MRATLQDPYQGFLAYVQRERAHEMWRSYSRVLAQLQAAYPTPDGLTAERVRDWLARPVVGPDGAEHPRAASTRRKEHGCLKAFWRYMHDTYALPNIMAEVRTPPRPRRLRPKKLSRSVVNEVVAAVLAPQQRAIVLLMADAGLRVSEACELTPSRAQLQGARRHLRVLGKGDAERLVPIGGRLVAALGEQLQRGKARGWHDEHAPLVRTATGAPYIRGKVWQLTALAGCGRGSLTCTHTASGTPGRAGCTSTVTSRW